MPDTLGTEESWKRLNARLADAVTATEGLAAAASDAASAAADLAAAGAGARSASISASR
jgi:hypothetical protein